MRAVDGVSLAVREGEVLGLVGESGCGKSTLARTILQLVPATSGAVILNGRNLGEASRSEMQACRRDLQMIFQDPYASLNPRMTVLATLAEPLLVHGICPGRRCAAASTPSWRRSASRPGFARKYPHEFSGGQRQRIAIARALALAPEGYRGRRAGVGARRVDPGADPQPPLPALPRDEPHPHLHRP